MVPESGKEQKERGDRPEAGRGTSVRGFPDLVVSTRTHMSAFQQKKRLVKQLAAKSDVIIENFKPGSKTEWTRSNACALLIRRLVFQRWRNGVWVRRHWSRSIRHSYLRA